MEQIYSMELHSISRLMKVITNEYGLKMPLMVIT